MHGLLPAQRATTFTLGDHHAGAPGECCAAQSPAAASARSLSAEPGKPAGRLGLAGEPPRGSRESLLRHTPAGTAPALSAAASGVVDRLQGTGDREKGNTQHCPDPRGLSDITSGVFLKLLILGLIRFYQACLSPVMPSACRFYPSCSAYAFEAVEKWGVWKGGRLAVGRLLRCRPWSSSYGYDPVPEKQVTGYREQVLG